MNYDKESTLQQMYAGDKLLEIFRDEFNRRCSLRYAQLQAGAGNDEQIDKQEIEFRIAEDFAQENNILFNHSDLYSMWKIGPAGDENETFYDGKDVFKMNNLWHCQTISNFINKIFLHNSVFPETSYSLFGFCGEHNRSIYPIVKQTLIQNASPATQEEIDNHMLALGYKKEDEGKFSIDNICVGDLFPKNVLRTTRGSIFVIDAEIEET